jgi:hypothetical protein
VCACRSITFLEYLTRARLTPGVTAGYTPGKAGK